MLKNDSSSLIGLSASIALVCLIGGIFMASLTCLPEVKYVHDKANQCHLTKEVERDDLDRIYCGKACTRPAREYTYQCDREQKTLTFVD